MKLKFASLMKLSWPIMMGYIGTMLIGIGDVYVAGQHSTITLGAIGVANGVINPIFLLGIGLLSGISPFMSIKRGEGKTVKDHLPTLLYYAVILSLMVMFLLVAVNAFVPLMGFQAQLEPIIMEYIQIVSFSILPAFIFQATKEYLQSFEDVFFANLVAILMVVFNIALSFVLVFGINHWSGLGAKGLAYGTLITRVTQAILIILYAKKDIIRVFIDSEFLGGLFRFSFPIGGMYFLEVLAFSLVSILMGVLSIEAAAANNIVLSVASLTFMVPLSISSAVAVKVGRSFGGRDLLEIKSYATSAIVISTSFMAISALTLWLAAKPIVSLYSQDEIVIHLGVSFLAIVALFQVVDGLQVTLCGVLRGVNKSFSSSALVFVGYWLIGIPLGVLLTFFFKVGAVGLWQGLALSLAIVSVLLATYYTRTVRYLANVWAQDPR